MYGKVLLVVVRCFIVATALLHASQGAKPRLEVVYNVDGVDNRISLECVDGNNFRQLGPTYTFRNPDTLEVEDDVPVVQNAHTFTIGPTNESLVSCTLAGGSEESDRVMVAAIPQYPAGVTAIKQYVYSDTAIAEIECPFQLGRLSSLYTFSWERVVVETGVPITENGTRGVYWLAGEYNRTLYVNLSAAVDRNFQCDGRVQTCRQNDTSSCTSRRPMPERILPITIINTTDPVNITESPSSVVVNENEVATFNCTATGAGDLTTVWKVGEEFFNNENCSGSPTCKSIRNASNDGYVTSTLNITALTSLDVTCIMHQNYTIEQPDDVKVILPPTRTAMGEVAQLTVMPVTTPPLTTTQPVDPSGGTSEVTNSQPVVDITIITAVIGVIVLIIILILAVCIICIFRYHYKNKESQLGRRLRRTFSRDPQAIFRERYTQRDPSPRQYDVEIQGTDTPPIIYTGPNSTTHMPNGNNFLGTNSEQQIYNISQNSGVSGVSSYSGMSGVSQNHGPHHMPQFGEPPVHLGLPPGSNGNHNYVDHHSIGSRRTSDTSGSVHSGYSHAQQPLYQPTAFHSSHIGINQQQQYAGGHGHPESASLQYVVGGYPTPPHVARDIHHQQPIDPQSSLPVLTQYPANGVYFAYPQLAASQPLQTMHSDLPHSTHSSHSGHSHRSSGRQSPVSTHSQRIQHSSPHMQPIPAYQPPTQSHLISANDLATVQLALMHNRHCQIPGCCCYKVRELMEAGGRGRTMSYDSPEMSIRSSSSGSGNSRVHKVSHQASSTDSDSDYSSLSDRRSRPPNLRLLSDEHNRNPNLHPHYHLTTKSHMRRVSMYAPVDHRRSKSLSDLTPVVEVPETCTPAKTPAIGGSVKAGTPVYCCQEGATEQVTSDDCICPNQPMLLREISISADNIPALCLNDCPFTPSPLKEGCRMLAGTPGRRKGSFRRSSMRSTKPKLRTVKEKTSSAESDDSNTSSRSNTPVKSSQSDDEGIDIQRHHSQECKSSPHKHTPDTTSSNKEPVHNAHETITNSTQQSSLGIESSQCDRSSDDEVREILQNAPARDIKKTLSSHSPLLARKSDSTNSSYLSSNGNAMSDPRMRRSVSPLSIGSSSQVSVHSRRSASPYETEVRRQNGVITEITEC